MPLLEQPAMVALYRDLGVRQMHFAYNRNNSVAGGCHDDDCGLTPLGRRMVAAVNEAGVLMGCSHTGRRASLESMDASVQPVIFSHSNPLALVEHGRNVTDEQIRACAATGGVVCVSGVSAFVGSAFWTVHPLQTEAAAWITSRGDVACGALTFGAVLAAPRPEAAERSSHRSSAPPSPRRYVRLPRRAACGGRSPRGLHGRAGLASPLPWMWTWRATWTSGLPSKQSQPSLPSPGASVP